MTDDAELLRRYAEENSEEAFAEVVQRHIDFVYAAALRQTRGNTALAEDITQTVFADCAGQAGKLARHQALVGWLHTATRFAAAKAVRSESRRKGREQQVYTMNEILRDETTSIDWERVQPVLDAVLGELKERERVAILLRFFEKQPLANVAARLSLTETAARSCIDRALDRMRERLAQRGVTSTTAALGLALANQAGVAAPAGLLSAIVSASAGSIAAGVSVGGMITFMNMSKVAMGAVVLTAAIGFGVYEHGESGRAHARLAVALRERDNLQEQLRLAQKTTALAEHRTAEAQEQARANLRMPAAPRENLFEDALAVWIGKVDKLTGFLRQHPELNLPGMEAITVEEWLDVTKDPQFQSEADFRKALGTLRGKVRQKWAPEIGKAWKEALEANGGETPADLQSFAAFLPAGFDPSTISRLELNPSGAVPGLAVIGIDKPQWLLVDRPADAWDTVGFYGRTGGAGYRTVSPSGEFFVRDAIVQFTRTNGTPPTSAAELTKFSSETRIMNSQGKPSTATRPKPEELEELFRALTTKP